MTEYQTAMVSKNDSLRLMANGRTMQALVAGEQVDIVSGDDNGWTCVRAQDTGRTGFIASGSISIPSAKASADSASDPIMPGGPPRTDRPSNLDLTPGSSNNEPNPRANQPTRANQPNPPNPPFNPSQPANQPNPNPRPTNEPNQPNEPAGQPTSPSQPVNPSQPLINDGREGEPLPSPTAMPDGRP